MSTHGSPLTVQRFRRLSGVVIANIPDIGSDLSSDLEGNGDAVAVMLKRALTRENFDAALVELGKKDAAPIPCSEPLLIPVGTATVDVHEPIVLSPEFLQEHYNIKWRNNNFDKWFLGRTTAPFGGSTLAYVKLAHSSVDSPIIAGLGGAIAARTEPIEILRLIGKQKNGQPGPLLVNGYANIAYWEDETRFPEDEQVAYVNEAGKKVVLRAVDFDWGSFGRYWDADAYSVLDPVGWSGGYRVFSRNSR